MARNILQEHLCASILSNSAIQHFLSTKIHKAFAENEVEVTTYILNPLIIKQDEKT